MIWTYLLCGGWVIESLTHVLLISVFCPEHLVLKITDPLFITIILPCPDSHINRIIWHAALFCVWSPLLSLNDAFTIYTYFENNSSFVFSFYCKIVTIVWVCDSLFILLSANNILSFFSKFCLL